MSTVSPTSVGQSSPPLAVRWRHWPLRDEFVKHAVPLFAVSALSLGAAIASHNGWIAAVLLGGWTIVSWPMILPSEYELSASGITHLCAGRATMIPWRMVRSRRELAGGVFLSMKERGGLFQPAQTIFVPFASRRQEILQSVRHYLGHVPEK